MLVGRFELVQPLDGVLVDYEETVVGALVFGLAVVGPAVDAWHVYDDPVVFECPHCHISQNH